MPMHTKYMAECWWVCVCIKQPLTAIGAVVVMRPVCLPWQRFSIPHSSVIFSTVTSGNPLCREALSFFYVPPLTADFLSLLCHLPNSAFFSFLFSPSLLRFHSPFTSYLNLGSYMSPLTPKPQFIFLPSFS